ncbi:MAG: four helix bundle protein [Patescibacteria group bacterium]
MDKNELKDRTKKFALRTIKLVNVLPYNSLGNIVRNQLLRCATSTAANYRAVCRSRTTAEFNSKLGVVIEEADESVFWLEIIIESKIMKEELVLPLLNEASEITAIMVASRKTSIKNTNLKF